MKRLITGILSAGLLLSAVCAPAVVSAAVEMKAESVYIEAPQIQSATYYSIELAKHPDYEYRIDGGEWSDAHTFNRLQADTEYTFEQRNRVTGAVSEPMVFRTHHRGASTAVHNDQLVAYVQANGEKVEGGRAITYSQEEENGSWYHYLLTQEKTRASFGLLYDGSQYDNIVCLIFFELNPSSGNIDVVYEAAYLKGENVISQAFGYMPLGRQQYGDNFVFTYKNATGNLNTQKMEELLNNGFAMLMDFWDQELYAALGFGFKGLGFSNYSRGLGETFCDVKTGYHTGTLEDRYQRDPGCEIAGSNGYQVCTACGEAVKYYGSIPAKGAHIYDNACDESCNECGLLRNGGHQYLFDCSTVCYVCGEKRTTASAQHTPAATGQCTTCGEKEVLAGDVTGDGKLNVSDVSRLYAHIRNTRPMTNANALLAADVNGDGKINIADTSKLYALVRNGT